MTIRAFRMKLKKGKVAEYRRRQQNLWPHLSRVLSHVGIYDYSIFLDEETLDVFAVLRFWPDHQIETLESHPVVQRWWKYMAAVLETGPDQRPKEWPLDTAFRLG